MNPNGGTGDLVITVGGDLTPLETALASVPEAFAGLTSEVDSAFAGLDATLNGAAEAANVVTSQIENLASAAAGAEGPITALGEQLDLFAAAPLAELPAVNEQLSLFATYAGEAAVSAESLGAASASATPSIAALGAGASEADQGLTSFVAHVGLSIAAFFALKDSLEAIVTAYADVQKAEISLSALLGDAAAAHTAIEGAKELADALGQTQEAVIGAQQRLVALGEPLAAVPRDLQAIADGAAAMNTGFETAAQRFDQIVNSGALMQRSLTSIGLSVQDVAQAMGMAGVPATILTTAFKGLDEQQRAAIISSAELSKNMGIAAQAASGVAGAWNQVKNAFNDALEEMGKQVDGFKGLAGAALTAIKGIEDLFVALVGDIKLTADAVLGFGSVFEEVFGGMGSVIADSIAGNFKAIPDDVENMATRVKAVVDNFLQSSQKDWGDTSNSIATIWGTGMKSVGASTQAAATQSGAALNVLQLAAQNAQKNFAAVATAFAAGKVSATDYTAALTALNKAQMDANKGFELASTAALIAANNYREITVNTANAQTTLKAIAQDISAGTASWTQYDAALKELDAVQKQFNNGLQDSHTAMLLAAEDFQNMGVAVDNALTYLEAVVADMQKGAANAIQYSDALATLDKAQRQLNGGFQDGHTAYLMAVDDFDKLQVAATNATTKLIATYAAYIQNKQGLDELISSTNAYADAQTRANGGVETWQSAMLKVAAAESTAELALQNANTELGAANAAFASGAIGAGVYQGYVDKVKQSQDALTGTQKALAAAQETGATSANHVASSTLSMNSALSGSAGAMTTASGAASTFATNLQYINGQWIALGNVALTATGNTTDFATSLNVLNGQFINVGNAAATATSGGLAPFASSLQYINGQFVNLTSSSANAASGIGGVGKAAAAVTSEIGDLVNELDTFMNDAVGVATLGQSLDQSLNAKLGDISVNVQPGDQVTTPRFADIGLGWKLPSPAVPFTGIGNTNTIDPAAAAAALQSLITSANQAAAATNTSTAATNAYTAASDASTTATNSSTVALNALSPAVTNASNAISLLGTDATGTSTTFTDTASATIAAQQKLESFGSTAGKSSAELNALNDTSQYLYSTFQALGQGVMDVTGLVSTLGSTFDQVTGQMSKAYIPTTVTYGPGASGSPGGGPTMPGLVSADGSPYITPYIGSRQPWAEPGNVPPIVPYTGSSSAGGNTITVHLNNSGIVVGQNGMQQFSTMVGSNLVQQLARLGIRLTRQ